MFFMCILKPYTFHLHPCLLLSKSYFQVLSTVDKIVRILLLVENWRWNTFSPLIPLILDVTQSQGYETTLGEQPMHLELKLMLCL